MAESIAESTITPRERFAGEKHSPVTTTLETKQSQKLSKIKGKENKGTIIDSHYGVPEAGIRRREGCKNDDLWIKYSCLLRLTFDLASLPSLPVPFAPVYHMGVDQPDTPFAGF